jgi:hypothetical protein
MKRLAVVLCALGVLCLGAMSASAQAESTQTADDQCLQKGGNLTDGKCILSANLRISVDYPLDLAQNPLIANAIDPYIQQAKNDLLSGLQDSFQPGSAQYELDITYSTFHHGDNILSLVFDFYQFTGGAHGISGSQTFTFDLAANQVLALSDLFVAGSDPFKTIGALAEADLNEKLKDISDADWIHSGTGEDSANYTAWALDGTDLVLYFPPYQVAAYVAGEQTVRIPLAQLSSILKPEFQS